MRWFHGGVHPCTQDPVHLARSGYVSDGKKIRLFLRFEYVPCVIAVNWLWVVVFIPEYRKNKNIIFDNLHEFMRME